MKLVLGLKIFTSKYKFIIRQFYKGATMASDMEREYIKQFKLTRTVKRIGEEFELTPIEIAMVLNKELFYKKL